MLRQVLSWCAIAVPTAALLVGVAALAFSLLGSGETQLGGAQLLDTLGFALLQTVAPVAIWVAVTARWPGAREHLALEAALFPLAVALVGWATLQAVGGRLWPTSTDALVLSIIAWLGFSWALLVARAIAERLFPATR